MTIDWDRFRDIVRGHQRFLLTSHVRPDCDALGSELGMAAILESLGKDVRIVNGQATPPNLEFIDPARRILCLHDQIVPADLDDRQVLMVLDTSAWAQLGPMGDVVRSTPAKKIVLDHHVSEDDLGAESFKNTTAEATGRLVAEAAHELGVPLTPRIATPLFAAMATDTGWFRFPSVDAGTYHIAAKLVAAGASPAEIYRDLYEQDTLGRIRLRGVILSRAVAELDGQLIHTFVRWSDFTETGSHPSDTEDVINMTLAVRGVRFGVIIVEQRNGAYKISLRSRCEISCSQIAEQFGGGGHKAAAGATLAGTLDDVRDRILVPVRAALQHCPR